MKITWYNIGIEPSPAYPNGFSGIDYCPNSELPFFVWSYARKGRESEGGGYKSQEILMRHLGFFERANANWFIPFLERMAKGEVVAIEEIQSKHMELFGKPLEEV